MSALALLASAAPAWAQVPIALERRVHAASSGFELRPSVTMDQYGRSVIAWESSADGNVLFRAFDQRAVPETEEIVINHPNGAHRSEINASARRGGEVYFSFNSSAEGALGAAGPFARCLDRENDFSCDVFRVPEAEILLNGSGGYVDVGPELTAFTWYVSAEEGQLPKLAAAVFGRGPGSASETFIVDDGYVNESDSRRSPRIAVLDANRIVVVWSELGADSDAYGVVGRIFNRSGVPVSPLFVLSTFETGDQVAPDVAAAANGEFVAVWESWQQDGSDQGIYGQLFSTAGQKIGDEFRVSSLAPTGQHSASVDMDTGGRFAVSWSSHQETPDQYKEIYARAYDAHGTPITEQFQVTRGGQPFDEQETSDVAISDSGLLSVAYESYRCDPESGCSRDVMASWFSLPCNQDATTLCLRDGRFSIRAFWKDYAGREGAGSSSFLSDESGGFWFFSLENLELFTKMIDGCDSNQSYWFFGAGLTDVEVVLLVRDAQTGRIEAFGNQLGVPFPPIQTIGSFPACAVPARISTSRLLPSRAPARASGLDGGHDGVLLHDGRFDVRIDWRDFSGRSGHASGSALSEESALFSFFFPENLEIAVKVIDGCAGDGHFWVYAAGLTNVEVQTTIEERATGRLWTDLNPLGRSFQPRFDTQAFSCN